MEKIGREHKGNHPLQDGASPQAERWSEPTKEHVTSFMHDEIRGVDEEVVSMHAKRVHEEDRVKGEPRRDRRA